MRVVDTPITELGFAGVGVGAAMVGLRPVIEFMTWNFALLAIDQIVNSAAKMLYMSGGQFNMPIVFRGPNGAALQLVGAALAGVGIVAGAHPRAQGRRARDARTTRRACSRARSATTTRWCFLEGEMLYNTKGEVPEGELLVPIGKAELKREGATSLLDHRHGKIVARRAAGGRAARQGQGIAVEVVDLRIAAADGRVDAILASVAKTNRAVVARGRLGASAASARRWWTIIQRDCFDELDAPVLRVHQADVPMPYTKKLERLAKPDARRRSSRPSAGSCTSTDMATKVVMEALSPTMEEGRLVKWLKNGGDAVKSGETLAEVETDKAIMELVARGDGAAAAGASPEGDTVPVGDLVGVIGAPGETVDARRRSPRPRSPRGAGSGERSGSPLRRQPCRSRQPQLSATSSQRLRNPGRGC